jgi:hypothetical protein
VWDVQAVRYAYTQFAPGVDERAGLEAILAENRARGYLYMTDRDARPAGAAHPLAAMWDNGGDPIDELGHVMAVRRAALQRFGERNLPPGAPLGDLAEVLAPLYFGHRYQVEAAAKSIGGLDYSYTLRGDGAPPARAVSPARQRAALDAVLATLDPEALDLPDSLIVRLVPRSVDQPPRRESFDGRTGPAFDPIGAAATAADMSLATLLPPERLARLVDTNRRDSRSPGVDEVLGAIERRVFVSSGSDARLGEIRRTVQSATVRRLLIAAAEPRQTPAVRAALEQSLERLGDRLARAGGGSADRALGALLAREIRRYLSRPAGASPPFASAPGAPPDPPPGPPIGGSRAADECAWSR